MELQGSSTRRRVRRRWCIPPAILRDPADKIEGDSILTEVPGLIGLLLWRTVRDVTLWAGSPTNVRGGLFAAAGEDVRLALLATAELPRQLAGSLDTLNGLLAASSRADAETVSMCALEVAAWARSVGKPHTAIAFAQAGAVAAPMLGDPALTVGVYARAAGQPARAETWLRRAVAVSRREKNWAAYASALVELGRVHEGRGDAVGAERLYRMGYAASRRFSAGSARMQAAHGLFRLALKADDEAGAAQFALSAQRAYDGEAAAAPEFLLDVARFWTDVEQPRRAAAALRRLAPKLAALDGPGRLAALALTARAQAETGHARRSRASAGAAWALLADEATEVAHFPAAVDLAHAARATDDLTEFRRAEGMVLRLATRVAFPDVAKRMAELWPHSDRLDRAS